MTLAEWLSRSGIPLASLAGPGWVHAVTVSKWRARIDIARPAQSAAVAAATRGAVTADDALDLLLTGC